MIPATISHLEVGDFIRIIDPKATMLEYHAIAVVNSINIDSIVITTLDTFSFISNEQIEIQYNSEQFVQCFDNSQLLYPVDLGIASDLKLLEKQVDQIDNKIIHQYLTFVQKQLNIATTTIIRMQYCLIKTKDNIVKKETQ